MIRREFWMALIFLCLLQNRIFGQDGILELVPEDQPVKVDTLSSASSAVIFGDVGSILLPVDDTWISGFSMKLGGVGKRCYSALAMDVINTTGLCLPYDFEVLFPRYKYFMLGVDNEFKCYAYRRFSVLIHLKAGWGFKSYSEEATSMDTYYYQSTDSSSAYELIYENNSGTLTSNGFFAAESGATFLICVNRWLSLGASVDSRYAIGINESAAMRDKSLFAGELFMRFKMPD